MATNYQRYIEEACARKERMQSEALEMMYDDPTVPRKMLRSINRARGDAFSEINHLRYADFVSRNEVASALEGLETAYQGRKGRQDTSDPDGFGTGVYVDAIQVLREALAKGDAAR